MSGFQLKRIQDSRATLERGQLNVGKELTPNETWIYKLHEMYIIIKNRSNKITPYFQRIKKTDILIDICIWILRYDL